jgi:AmmeMemoRadiSam system protein B
MKVRASTVDGIFYPASREALAELVGGLLAGAGTPGTADCVVSPHASYDYSGALAAAAFQAAAARPVRRVVLLGPVHREPTDRLLLPESEAFQTPLGSAPVDRETVDRLAGEDPCFALDDIPHLEEHCLEVQLPFVQTLFPEARLVPVLMGRPAARLVEALARALERTLGPGLDGSLVAVSANLTSYRPREQGQKEARALLDLVLAGDGQALLEAAARKAISSCGAGCIAAILALERRLGAQAEVLKLASSLPLGGDERKVVHYAAIAFERTKDGKAPDIRGTQGIARGRARGD